MPHPSIVQSAVVGGILLASSWLSPTIFRGNLAAQARAGTVHVSVTDKKTAITDLQASDLELKVGGKKQEITNVRPAAEPLRVALLVADGGIGTFQLGVARFLQKLQGLGEFAIISVIVQPDVFIDYSNDFGALLGGVRRLGPRGPQRGAQLMEAIQDTSRKIRREATRPVIIAMRVGAEAPTSLSGDDVREDLRKSGAILYVVSTVGADRPAGSQARAGISTEQAQLHNDEVVSGALNLAQVLGDGARESGGRHDQVVSTTMVPTFEQIADELKNQYEITYTLPDKVKAREKLSVSSKRKGMTVHAPSRLTH